LCVKHALFVFGLSYLFSSWGMLPTVTFLQVTGIPATVEVLCCTHGPIAAQP
jgi:hypothetical protein